MMTSDYEEPGQIREQLDSEDYDVWEHASNLRDHFGLLMAPEEAAVTLAVTSHLAWVDAGKPWLDDDALYDALYEVDTDHPDYSTVEQLAAAGRYFGTGRHADMLRFALATSERVRAASDAMLLEAVRAARRDGRTWEYIAGALGLARQNAYRRFAHRLEA